MRIIILGAGQVGGTLARNLAREDNDVTLVDQDDVEEIINAVKTFDNFTPDNDPYS